MRQAADILASPAAMEIRQLDVLQAMAKTSASKVIFVPMNLQSNVLGQLVAENQRAQQATGEGEGSSVSPALTAGLINAVAGV
jgi:hypothetical protein